MTRQLHRTDLVAGSATDLDAVAGVMAQAFDPRFGEAWTRAQCLGMLSLPGVWLTLAKDADAVVGFALARATVDEGELLLLAVLPDRRGRGTGGALLHATLAEARRRGIVRLHLEVRQGNGAVKLYVAQSFRKIGERRNYYRGAGGELFDAHSYSCVLE